MVNGKYGVLVWGGVGCQLVKVVLVSEGLEGRGFNTKLILTAAPCTQSHVCLGGNRK